jgi:hypothetical protein
MAPDGVELACRTLRGSGVPDLGTVDDVARLVLSARRVGAAVVVADVAPALRELLELAGLPIEMEGRSEPGGQPLALGHGRGDHRGDPLT